MIRKLELTQEDIVAILKEHFKSRGMSGKISIEINIKDATSGDLVYAVISDVEDISVMKSFYAPPTTHGPG